MTQKKNDHLGGGFSEHIYTKRVKLAHFAHRKLLEMYSCKNLTDRTPLEGKYCNQPKQTPLKNGKSSLRKIRWWIMGTINY